jgi:tRNA(Arg) A34 adenosine deaminase TadA
VRNKRKVVDGKPDPSKDYGSCPLLATDHPFGKRGLYLNGQYLGHNIAAFATDRDGYIIDFDFNHNEIFNSSVEHAEARLLNRLFKLTNIHDAWDVGARQSEAFDRDSDAYGNALKGVTVYTSLESCAQCSGIMTLGNVNEVIYLQTDPGQYNIGNILYRLSKPDDETRKTPAPRPVSADSFSFKFFNQLDSAYQQYSVDKNDPSMTSFLCTETAYLIYLAAEEELARMKLAFPGWHKPTANGRSALDNDGVLKECLSFFRYVAERGRRGTPH